MLEFHWESMLFTGINLLILLVLVRLFLFRPINNIIAARQQEANKEIDDANAAKAEAAKLQAQCETAMQELEADRSEKIAASRKEATVEYDRIIGEAKENARTIVLDAKTEAEQEKEKILRSAEADISDMVVAATIKAMANQSSPENDKLLYDQFLTKVGDSLDSTDI